MTNIKVGKIYRISSWGGDDVEEISTFKNGRKKLDITERIENAIIEVKIRNEKERKILEKAENGSLRSPLQIGARFSDWEMRGTQANIKISDFKEIWSSKHLKKAELNELKIAYKKWYKSGDTDGYWRDFLEEECDFDSYGLDYVFLRAINVE